MDPLLLLALLGLAGAGVHLNFMQKEQDRLNRDLFQYKNLASTREPGELIQTKENLTQQVSVLRQELSNLEEEEYIQSFGFYEPKYDFINSEDYAARLKQIKSEQKKMIRDGTAALCQTKWIVKDSEKMGRKLTQDFLKLVLIAFNTEAEDVIDKVKHSNIQSSEERIFKSFERLNKLSETTTCEITQKYLSLKLSELHLWYEMICKKQQEKEQEQERRKDENERKALVKDEEEVKKAEQKEEMYQQKIDDIRQAIQQSEGERRKQLEFENNRLQGELEKAKVDTEQAISSFRARKEGYIYVISNVGSLGKGIYRICKSVRDENFISEMNPVLPFPFDVHFRIFSEDSSDILRSLHNRFQFKRVNLHNNKREFFQVSIDEIAQAIDEIKRQPETGVLHILRSDRVAQAFEYQRTIAERSKMTGSTANNNYGRQKSA